MRDIFYIIIGYLAGSILFARLFGVAFKGKDITKDTVDGNPGVANAFKNGGFLCGACTLCCDLLKGFLPVFFYMRGTTSAALTLVIAAPVIGHVFPVFHRFRGGKGITATFGSLLGLLPDFIPVLILAFFFIFFSIILCISPHYYRTLFSYLCAEIAMFFLAGNRYIVIGFTLIMVAVGARMLLSKEKKGPIEVNLLWMH